MKLVGDVGNWKIVAHIAFKFYSVASGTFSTGSTPQQRCQLHQLFVTTAPLVPIRNESFPVADVVGTATGELFVGGPAALAVGDPLTFIRQHEIYQQSRTVRMGRSR